MNWRLPYAYNFVSMKSLFNVQLEHHIQFHWCNLRFVACHRRGGSFLLLRCVVLLALLCLCDHSLRAQSNSAAQLAAVPLAATQNASNVANTSQIWPATLLVRVFPEDARLYIQGNQIAYDSMSGYYRRYNLHGLSGSIVVRAEGYRDMLLSPEELSGTGDQGSVELKLERSASRSSLELLATLPSGSQPKSIHFSSDGSLMYAAQLNGNGIDLYRSDTFEHVGSVALNQQSGQRGFVEFATRPGTDELWVSQMTTGQIHILNEQTLEVQARISAGGSWTKVICFDAQGHYAFVSNWLSENIGVIDCRNRELIGAIPVGSIPRGLAIDERANRLLVSDYEYGRVLAYDLAFLDEFQAESAGAAEHRAIVQAQEPAAVLSRGPGAKRHICVSNIQGRIFVSDMMYGRIEVYDLDSYRLIASVSVGPKLNTIALDPSERYLYISSRGRNNPQSYLIPGPDFGKVYVLDTESLEVVDWVWGGNQPTGLALSPDGRLLVFSDFLDDRLEVYSVAERSASNPLVALMSRRRREVLQFLQGQ